MTGPDDREQSELRDFGRGLSRYAAFRAPPVMRARVRASLLAAPVALAPSRPSAARRTWLSALRPGIAALVVLALVAAGTASAAASSLPGEPAFGLKRAVEEIQVALATDNAVRLNVLVAQADLRLVDLETTAARRPSALVVATDEYLAAVERVEAMLTRVAAEPIATARATALVRAATASADHLARLETLAARLPSSAQLGIQRATRVQLTVYRKAADGLGGGGGSPLLPSIPLPPPTLPLAPPVPGLPTGVPGLP